jgi:hypothetical protein
MPAGPPPRAGLPVIDPPSLCEAGPCRNYHRLVSAMDAADPVGETGNLKIFPIADDFDAVALQATQNS